MSDVPHRELNMRIVLWILAAAMSLGMIFWVSGELLNVVATGHFTGTSIVTGAMLGLRMLPNISAPAAAWPEGQRPVFNNDLFWILSALLLGLVIWLLAKNAERWGTIVRGRDKAPRSARWAKSSDLSALKLSKASKGRLILGRRNNQMIAGEPRASCVVIGPTQTGKTTGLAIPAIIEWAGPVLAASVKTDLLDHTIAVRREKGNVSMFDPAQVVDMHRRHTWSPLARSKTFEGALKTAKSLVATAKQSMGGAGENDFWFKHAQTILAPVLYAAAIHQGDMSTVVRWLDKQEQDEVRAALVSVYDGLDDLPLNALQGIWMMGAEQRDSVYLTALSVIEAYRSPTVLDSARTSDITPEHLLDGLENTAYLCAPLREMKELAPIYATLITQIIDYAYEVYTRSGQPLDPPLLIVLDEAANIAPLEELDQIASTAAGVGIQLLTIFQDLGQVRERWGHDKAQTIVSNHRAKLVLSGVACEHTLSWVAKVTGDQEVRQVSFTDGSSNKSSTDATAHRALLPANVVREMKVNTGLLIYGNIAPVALKLRPWYGDKGLRNLIEKAQQHDPKRFDPITGEVIAPAPLYRPRQVMPVPMEDVVGVPVRESRAAEASRQRVAVIEKAAKEDDFQSATVPFDSGEHEDAREGKQTP